MDQYLKYLCIDNSGKTMSTREGRVRLPLAPLVKLEPRWITSEQLAKALSDWAKGKKTSTVRSGLQEAKALWKWLLEEEIITKKHWEDVWEKKALTRFMKQYPKKDARVRPQYTMDEAKEILSEVLPYAAQELRGVPMMVCIILPCGLRVGEVLKLQAKHLDHGCQVITVEKAKTDAGNRVVRVPKFLVPLLSELKANCKPTERLFPYTYDQVYPKVRKLQASLGLVPLAFHAMRRTNSTARVLAGQSANEIEKAFGHTDFENMTNKHYVAQGTVELMQQEGASQLFETAVKERHLKLVSG